MQKTGSRKKRKRGQSAIEYMASNAWIVVIAMLGLAVLWQLGVFTPPTPRRGSIGFSQLTPTDWVVSTENVAYVRILNEAGVPVSIAAGGMSLNVYQVACNSTRTPASEVTLYPGYSKLFIFYCTDSPTIDETFLTGDYYEGDLKIDYTNTISGGQHSSVGKIFGPIEGPTPFGAGTTTTTLPGSCGDACTSPGVLNGPLLNNTDCVENCTYCEFYSAECVPRGSCGDPCTEVTESDDCYQTCQWCNPATLVCEQGDCGKPCFNDNECLLGCRWCDPATNECSYGSSCGEPCDESFGGQADPLECEVECQFCYDYVFECVQQGDCGQPCVINDDCPAICCYCNSGTHTCEQGDCGKECTISNDCTRGCTSCFGGRCRGCAIEPWPTTSTTVTTTSTTSSTTSSTTTSGYIIAGQLYPENGSVG